jgi:hypothetical protein
MASITLLLHTQYAGTLSRSAVCFRHALNWLSI